MDKDSLSPITSSHVSQNDETKDSVEPSVSASKHESVSISASSVCEESLKEEKKAAPLVSFGLISDVQYADHDVGSNYLQTETRYFRNARRTLQSALDSFRGPVCSRCGGGEGASLPLACVLSLGDIIDGRCSRKSSQAGLAIMRHFAQLLVGEGMDMCRCGVAAGQPTPRLPVVNLTGNHELYNCDRDELRRCFGYGYFIPAAGQEGTEGVKEQTNVRRGDDTKNLEKGCEGSCDPTVDLKIVTGSEQRGSQNKNINFVKQRNSSTSQRERTVPGSQSQHRDVCDRLRVLDAVRWGAFWSTGSSGTDGTCGRDTVKQDDTQTAPSQETRQQSGQESKEQSSDVGAGAGAGAVVGAGAGAGAGGSDNNTALTTLNPQSSASPLSPNRLPLTDDEWLVAYFAARFPSSTPQDTDTDSHPVYMVALDGYDVSLLGWPSDTHPKYQRAADMLSRNNTNSDHNSYVGHHPTNQRWVAFNGFVGERQLRWLQMVLQYVDHRHDGDQHAPIVLVCSHTPVYTRILWQAVDKQTTSQNTEGSDKSEGQRRVGSGGGGGGSTYWDPCASNSNEVNVQEWSYVGADPCALVWNAAAVLRILQRHSAVKAVLSGHDHTGAYVQDAAGIHHITVQGAIRAEPDLEAHAHVHVYPDRMEVDGRGLLHSRVLRFRSDTQL